MRTPLAALLTSPMPGSSVGGDPDASRTVYGAVIVLVLIGLALVFLVGWLLSSTRVDLRLLSPLETMSDRKWRKLDPASQRRLLDEERPEGARPLHLEASKPDVDDDFESGVHAAEGFDDLTEVDSGNEADPTSPVTLSAASDEVAEDDASEGSGAEESPDLDDAKVAEDDAGPADVATDDEDARENHAAGDAEVNEDEAGADDVATDDERAAAGEGTVDDDGRAPGGVPGVSAAEEEPDSRKGEESSADGSPDDIVEGAPSDDNQDTQSESATFVAAASESNDADESDAEVRAADSGASTSRRA